VVTAAALNTDLRDNMNELVLHRHSGGSGSGSNALGSLTSINFIDAAVPAAPGGTLTRIFTTATLFGWINAGGTFYAATSGHEHAIATATLASTSGATSTINATLITKIGSIFGSATTTLIASVFTASGTGSRAVEAVGVLGIYNIVATASTATVELRRDATIIASTIHDLSVATRMVTITLSTVELNRPSGSVTYALIYRSLANQSSQLLSNVVYVREFRQA
jgi:hypothetical protein